MLARIKSARGQRAVCLPHHPTLCFFSVPPPLFSPLVVIFERNEWITTKHHQQQQQQLRSQWSDPGTASDLLHQALMEAWQIQHHMGGQGGGGQRRWAGPKGLSQSPCSICLPHPSPLHILRRAETASHAETNVKINHYDLSCSALTCSPLVTFAFHISSRVISSSPNIKKRLFLHSEHFPPPFYAKWAAATISSPSVLSPGTAQNTEETSWGGLCCASEGTGHANVSFG